MAQVMFRTSPRLLPIRESRTGKWIPLERDPGGRNQIVRYEHFVQPSFFRDRPFPPLR
jgi:hypothetical protein